MRRILLLPLLFLGCGDNSVETVKNAKLPNFGGAVIGQSLENFKECSNVTWKSKDGVVSAVCTVKSEILSAEFDKLNAEYHQAVTRAESEHNRKIRLAEEEVNRIYQDQVNNNQEAINRYNDDLTAYYDHCKIETSPDMDAKAWQELGLRICEKGDFSYRCNYNKLNDELVKVYGIETNCFNRIGATVLQSLLGYMENTFEKQTPAEVAKEEVSIPAPVRINSKAYQIDFSVSGDSVSVLKASEIVDGKATPNQEILNQIFSK